MSDFLKNLKETLEKGEFNSENAKNFYDIVDKADGINADGGADTEKLAKELVDKRIEDNGGVRKVALTEEELKIANDKYEEFMIMTKMENNIGNIIAHLSNYEYEIEKIKNLLIQEIRFADDFIKNNEEFFQKNDNKDLQVNKLYINLAELLDALKTKYYSEVK